MARFLNDMEWSDDRKIDHILGPETPMQDYPPGLSFTIQRDDLDKFCEGTCSPGMTIRFSAMGTATSFYRDREDCRIEVELTQMAGEDGKFVDLDNPPSICLCGEELGKLDLEDEGERGDTIHIIGTARVERVASPSWGGDTVGLQIIEAAIEDESEESR